MEQWSAETGRPGQASRDTAGAHLVEAAERVGNVITEAMQGHCRGDYRGYFPPVIADEACPRMFPSGGGNAVMDSSSFNHSPLRGSWQEKDKVRS